MTQIGESVAVVMSASGENKVKCIFCDQEHQDEEPAPAHAFPRDMPKLKGEGRTETAKNRSVWYPEISKSPIVMWFREINETEGYKAAAHHCIALEEVNKHAMSGELHAAGYDPNRGTNCIWLPYNRTQFIRARAYGKPMQIHQGGHTAQYYKTVEKRIDRVAEIIATKFCNNKDSNKNASKEDLLRYMLQQENAIWLKVASAGDPAYHLYVAAYLDPREPWGRTHAEEQGKTQKEYLALGTVEKTLGEDMKAEAGNS